MTKTLLDTYGERFRAHPPDHCVGQGCPVHHPSDHHMVDWTPIWRGDRGITERLCPEHGVGHPDPDDLSSDTVHGCCGCCMVPRPDWATTP